MKKFVLTVLLAALVSVDIFACTSAIITGRLTPDGRPLLWKHRDTGELNNRMEWFDSKEINSLYSFLALVNSPDKGGIIWAGSNEAGFSIMNTASYNLKDDDVEEMDMEGVLMYKALGSCRTLADFEKFLDALPRPMRVEANFGIIDSEGGAAYYEVNNTKWVKLDVNDPRIAPHGYLVYTNFSYTGRADEGMGYIRYETADRIIREKSIEGNITPSWIIDNVSRSFYNSLMGIDMVSENSPAMTGSGFIPDSDFISRNSTSAAVVMQGVKAGENPGNTIIWTVLGYPPVSPVVPLFVKAGRNQPGFVMKSSNSENSEICNMALDIKSEIFPIHRGSGQKYLNFRKLYDKYGNGYMSDTRKLEKEILELYFPLLSSYREMKKIQVSDTEETYTSVWEKIKEVMKR